MDGGPDAIGWESDTKHTVESAKLEEVVEGGWGERSELGVGNPRAPHYLYETLYSSCDEYWKF